MAENPIYKEIKDLFQARDKAIQQKDRDLLISTQLDTARVFMPRCDNFSTEIITVVDDGKEGIKKVAFVKETQEYKDYDDDDEPIRMQRERYRVIHLVNTALGWRIARDW